MCASNCLFVMCLIAFNYAVSLPASPQLKYEEYIIEHEISSTQAKNSVLSIDLSSIKIPVGCQKCTQSEINYCLSKNLIADHCCCNKKYHEDLAFVPHTCYLGPQLCTTIIGDCIEYTRLKECCCDRYVIQKWKEKSAASRPAASILIITILSMYKCINYLNGYH